MNKRKRHLQVAERICIGVAAACLGAASLTHLFADVSTYVLPLVLSALLVLFYVAFAVAGVMREFAQSLGKRPVPGEDGTPISIAELKQLLQWSPRVYKRVAVLALATIPLTMLVFGGISWTTAAPLTQQQAIGASLYLSSMLLVMLPVIASAARVPDGPL